MPQVAISSTSLEAGHIITGWPHISAWLEEGNKAIIAFKTFTHLVWCLMRNKATHPTRLQERAKKVKTNGIAGRLEKKNVLNRTGQDRPKQNKMAKIEQQEHHQFFLCNIHMMCSMRLITESESMIKKLKVNHNKTAT